MIGDIGPANPSGCVSITDAGVGLTGTSGPCVDSSSPCAGCLIGADCTAPGAVNPGEPCLVCDPERDRAGWSSNDGIACDDGQFCTVNDACLAGRCSGAPRECDDSIECNGVTACDEAAEACETPRNLCEDGSICDTSTGSCVTTCLGCVISGNCIAAGAEDPGNPCLACDPMRSTTSYVAVFGKACGAPATACSGEDTCDEAGTCVANHVSDGVACGSAAAGPCRAVDACDGNGNCRVRVSENGTPCDDDFFCSVNETCQGGQCVGRPRDCGANQACSEGGGSCECQGCLVGGQCFARGASNPNDSCQICDPARSSIEFSPGPDPLCGSCPRRWGTAVPVPGVNSPESDAQATMTADLLRLCFMSVRPGGLGGQDIWCAARSSPTASFGAPVNQTSVNSDRNDGNPTLSADGSELIFSSNRPGGAGASDLYRSRFVPAAGAFGQPEPLSALNTTLSELGANLAADSLTLYYHASVDGTPEGLTIFVSTRASRNAAFEPGVAVTGLSSRAAEREPGPCPDQSFMTFCTNSQPPFALAGAPRLPNGGFGPQSPLQVGLPSVSPEQEACGPTVLTDGSLLFHAGPPTDLYIAPPLP